MAGWFRKRFPPKSNQRLTGSISDNIAEGFEREGNIVFIPSLGISNGSAGKARPQCFRAFGKIYISEEKLQEMVSASLEIPKSISGFMKYFKDSEYRGNKFK
ncbi:four helix bundle protein [Algoriphagus jejuensis]|uniref:four helix bundle protein n=1 Tax=Algoriphagus jejuensis TaxID=419934 RepID=UPI003CD08FD3